MAIVPRSQIQDPQQQQQQDPVQDPQNDPTQDPTQDPQQDLAKSYASADDVSSLKTSLAELRELIGQNLRSTAPAPTPTQHLEPAIDDVSDEELESYVKEGKDGAAKLIRKAVNAGVERRVRVLEKQLEQIQQFGVESIGHLSERIAKSDMKYMEHPKLGPKIKAAIKEATGLDARLRTDPRILKAVHDKVVGEHSDALIQEALEEAKRKARETGSSDPTQATGRTQQSTPQTPSPKELIGSEMTLEDADSWAKSVLGYKGGWDEYAKVIQKQREELT